MRKHRLSDYSPAGDIYCQRRYGLRDYCARIPHTETQTGFSGWLCRYTRKLGTLG
jgi:hypothetical protein